MADFTDIREEDEHEVYDIPPLPRPSFISRSESDYMNFKEMNVLPIPSLPPKKRTSVDLDEKFGTLSSGDKVGGSATTSRLTATESIKKHPVAAPRVKGLEAKQPVAMPRNRIRSDGVLPLPDATTTESNDFDIRTDSNDDKRNNNFGDFTNSNVLVSNSQDGLRHINGVGHLALKAENSLDCNGSSRDYFNIGLLKKLQTGAQNETNESRDGQSYMNMDFDIGRNFSTLASPASKPMGQQMDISNLHSAAALANASQTQALAANSPQESARQNVGQYMRTDSNFSEKSEDYANVSDFNSQDYMNFETPKALDTMGINLKTLMMNCIKADNIPPSLNSSANQSAPESFSAIDSPESFSSLLKLCDPLYESAPIEDHGSSDLFGIQNQTDVFSSSPPKTSPPPLPSNLLIDLSDDNFYKLPATPTPVVPSRPPQSGESPSPPPPVPVRKQSPETWTDDKLNKSVVTPVLESVVDSVVLDVTSPAVAISPPAKPTRKAPVLKTVPKTSDNGGRSVFYVGNENLYEAEPVAYEMESGATCPSLNNGVLASDQNELYEVAEYSLQKNSGLKISHQGLLYLMGNLQKSERKWCKLDAGSLTIFQDNQSAVPQEVAERVSMVSVSSIKDDSRQSYCFELSTRPPTVIYQFSADSEGDKATWMTQIARNMALINADDMKQISDINRGGNAFVRFGAESSWIHTWLHLVHKTLSIYNKDKKFDEVDLRKCKGLRSLQLADRCTKGFEMCPPLAIDLPSGRVIFIQSDLKKDQDGWFAALKDSIAMTDDSLTQQALTSDNVPVMVDKCINFVSAFGLDTQGIYRLNGQNSKVTRLQEEFRSDTRGMIIRSSEYSIHDAANALKRFFRQLDEPLFTSELYDCWITASGINNHVARLERYKSLLKSLPCVNYHTLKRIIFHLAMVADKKAENKMDSTNLASIFGPILFKVDKDSSQITGFGSTNQEIKILKDLVDDHQWIFDIKEEEVDQEKKIADAVKRIEELNTKPSPQTLTILEEGVLLGIHLNDRHGDVITLKVTNVMTADDLQKFVADKSRTSSGKGWSLFEVICNDELERPIQPSEKILEVTMKWSNWPHEFCQNNYLCYKFNKLQEPLKLVHDFQSSSLFSELHYTNKKSFHKYCFQYSQYILGFRKDSRAENPTTSWLVEDIVIYLGIQKIRNPPSKWGFTFFSLSDKLTVPYFGHSVCCSSEEELYRWLSAMIFSQHHHCSRSSSDRQTPLSYLQKPISAASSESNLNTTGVSSKWRLPFVKRR